MYGKRKGLTLHQLFDSLLNMKTNTAPFLIEKVTKTLGNGGVINHTPTEENKIGQSGVHTFVDDIMNVVVINSVHGFAATNEYAAVYRALSKLFFEQKIVKIEQ
jgi:hypothetical protein